MQHGPGDKIALHEDETLLPSSEGRRIGVAAQDREGHQGALQSQLCYWMITFQAIADREDSMEYVPS